jgi:hypothetical protein
MDIKRKWQLALVTEQMGIGNGGLRQALWQIIDH